MIRIEKKDNLHKKILCAMIAVSIIFAVSILLISADKRIPYLHLQQLQSLLQEDTSPDTSAVLIDSNTSGEYILPCMESTYRLYFTAPEVPVELQIDGAPYSIGKNQLFEMSSAVMHSLSISPHTSSLRMYFLNNTSLFFLISVRQNIRVISIGINITALIVAFFLFINKRSEKYLLVFVIYIFTNLIRVFVTGNPDLFTVFPLSLLNWNIPVGGLSPELSQAIQRSIHLLIVSFLQAFLIIMLYSPRSIKRFSTAYAILSLVILILIPLFGMVTPQIEDAFLILRWSLYIIEITAISRNYDVLSPGLIIFIVLRSIYTILFSIYSGNTITAPLFHHVKYFFDGGPLTESMYVSAVMIYLSEKFSLKFSEADRLKLELAGVNHNLEARIAEKTEELSASLDTVTALKNQQDRFISNVAHDLKTPMFSVMGYQDMLRSEIPELSEDASYHMDIIEKNITHMQDMLDHLLLISRLDSHRISLNYSLFQLYESIEEIHSMIRPKLDSKNIFYESFVEKDIMIYGDYGYLKECFGNIMDNASYWTNENGKISITAEPDETKSVIRISFFNTGITIYGDELKQIFERSYSAKSTRENGSGLGLSICSELIGLHGGKIWAEPAAGGMRFVITLPYNINENEC